MKLIPQQLQSNSHTKTDEELDHSFAGMITCLNAMAKRDSWVIDSGASDHMSHAHINRPSQFKEVSKGSKIYLPNGETSDISYKGCVTLANGLQLRDVLHVPTFKYNLLSISKLTKDNQCIVIFLS